MSQLQGVQINPRRPAAASFNWNGGPSKKNSMETHASQKENKPHKKKYIYTYLRLNLRLTQVRSSTFPMLEPKGLNTAPLKEANAKKKGNHVPRCNIVGLYKIIRKQHMYVKDQSAQRPMQTAWYIYKRASYIDRSYSQNRRATPQFVAIECVLILLQDSFPAWPQVIDTTFG